MTSQHEFQLSTTGKYLLSYDGDGMARPPFIELYANKKGKLKSLWCREDEGFITEVIVWKDDNTLYRDCTWFIDPSLENVTIDRVRHTYSEVKIFKVK